MALVNVNDIPNGTTAEAEDVNRNVNTLADEINGRLDNSNIASSAGIDPSKLSPVITSVKFDQTSSWTASTSMSDTGLELSLEPGVWLLMASLRFNMSVASDRLVSAEFYDDTAAARIGAVGSVRIANDTNNNANTTPLLHVETVSSTRTIKIRAQVTATSGTNTLSGTSFVAMRIAGIL